MRASRLLQILLLLQNRGRQTCATLARELEVDRRTILRDVDALTEAGLPVVVLRGNQGGIELGFNYRTRLTGLTEDEAGALGVLLSCSMKTLNELGMGKQAERAAAKLLESLPDGVREKAMQTRKQFQFSGKASQDHDIRIAALAAAVRERHVVFIKATEPQRRAIHPTALLLDTSIWMVEDSLSGLMIPLDQCGDLNISARTFAAR